MSGNAKDDDIRFEPDRFIANCSKLYSKWKVIIFLDVKSQTRPRNETLDL
jgi:hypothetical protein